MRSAIVILAAAVLAGGAAQAAPSSKNAPRAPAPAALPSGYPLHIPVPVDGSQGVRMDVTETGAARGKAVFQKWCSTCHGPYPYLSGTAALTEKYKGTNVNPVLERRANIPAALIRSTVRNGIYVMPPFRKSEVSDEELDAVVGYLTKQKK